jgi:hypothetical protein
VEKRCWLKIRGAGIFKRIPKRYPIIQIVKILCNKRKFNSCEFVFVL